MNFGFQIGNGTVLGIITLDLIHQGCNFLFLGINLNNPTLQRNYFSLYWTSPLASALWLILIFS